MSHGCAVTSQKVRFTKDPVSKKTSTAGIMENIKNAYCRNNPRSTVKSAKLNLTRAVPRLLLIASRNE